MAAIENTTTTQQMNSVTARAVDFVSRFTANWDALREVLGIARPIRKQPGTKLVSYAASITLQDGAVAEGDLIPFSQANVAEVAHADLTVEKYAKAVTLEAVNKYGADVAIEKTDDAFLVELQGNVMDRFYDKLEEGTLTNTATDFQMGVALAVGSVVDKFKKMHKTSGQIVVFVNTMDAYKYLGAAQLTMQREQGLTYVKDFMGADRMVLSSEIAEGKVIATASENLVLYYIDPSDSDFKKLGLNYVVQGETNLIGFSAEGNYSRAQGESYALMGMSLWAEYVDAIAVVTVGGGS